MTGTTSVRNSLLYLFDRPSEPVIFPKGEKQVVFKVPVQYLNERNQLVSSELENRFGDSNENIQEVIDVSAIQLPDMSIPRQLDRNASFSVFVPYHRQMAARLIEIFIGMRTLEDLRSAAVFASENCNPYLFIYAYSVALLHRDDTRDLPIPPLMQVFPDKFIGNGILSRARQEANVTTSNRIPLEIPLDYTATDLEIEHRVAYFREDVGINVHHWHWHLVYPFTGPDRVVRKDRRGELFYYMHQQVQARYNFERFSNHLGRVQRLLNLREPIKEGYFPKLDTMVSNRNYAARQPNTMLSDINREEEQIKFDLKDLERWEDRIFEAIHRGAYEDAEGQKQNLTERDGIDVLGNIIEASDLSVNKQLYGDWHNMMHYCLGLCHDPDNRHLETFQAVADPSTAMRDPVFYRLHAMVDDIFLEHKYTLPSYSVNKLEYQGVTITSAEVVSAQGVKNELTTFWQQDDINLTRGLDFLPRGPVYARITHLQHTDFSYNIKVDNKGGKCLGTVRIFLAPKFDERGRTLLFRDQKNLFIELDKFTVNLKTGSNVITRKSIDSSVTIPYEQTFRDLDTDRPAEGSDALAAFNYCGCGWPQHMLIPKGMPEGMKCDLFTMVSDYKDDKIDQKVDGKTCNDAASFCGLRDKLYPDKRSMGYPFDRLPRDGVTTLPQFMNGLTNMKVTDVSIKFIDRIDPPRALQTS